MSRSSVVPTRCSRLALALALVSCATPGAARDAPLTAQDQAWIEQGRQIVRSAQSDPPPALHNRHMDAAEHEARALLSQLQSSDPTLRAAQAARRPTDHRILVFASLSLGGGLDDLLDAASGQPDVVVVFRGVPEGMSLGDGLKTIQTLAGARDPIPNIVIDPTLFRTYNVTAVPTIVMPSHDAPGEQDTPAVVAQVSGLSDPAWLVRQTDDGGTGDFGTKGPVAAISEPDLIEVAKTRLAAIDWDAKRQQAIDRFWPSRTFHTLPRATVSRTREIDPTVVITRDIRTPDGAAIAQAGERINPLCDPAGPCAPGTRAFTQAVVVFDPQDARQMALLDAALPAIRQEPGVERITYIATEMDTDDGWDAYRQITDRLDAPVYLLTPDLVTRFALEHTPSVITAAGTRFVVRELAEESTR